MRRVDYQDQDRKKEFLGMVVVSMRMMMRRDMAKGVEDEKKDTKQKRVQERIA